MVLLWFAGDVPKAIFLTTMHQPLQLIASSFFQLAMEIIIISQFWIYRDRSNNMIDATKEDKEEDMGDEEKTYYTTPLLKASICN